MRSPTEKIMPTDRLADVPILAWGMSDVCKACNISRSSLERLRSAGMFPSPDRMVGRKPLWKTETVRAWLDGSDERGRGR